MLFLEKLYDLVDFPIMLYDLENNKIIEANEASSNLFGFESVNDFILNKNMIEIKHKIISNMEILKNKMSIQLLLNKQNNEEFYAEIWVSFVGPNNILIKIKDISELKRTQELLKESNEKNLKLKNEIEELKGIKFQILSNISHEIRTPMNGIIGLSELLEFTELTKKQKHYLEGIKYSSNILLQIIDNILEISNKLELEIKEFSIDKLFDDIITNINSNMLKIETKIIFYAEGNIEIVLGDFNKIKQILLNFINNSIKFTEKGEIIIFVKKLSEKEDSVVLEFSVKDTGIGISKEVQTKIFNPFIQGDLSNTKKFQGIGLGLFLSKKLSDFLKGTIFYETEENKGSCFNFKIELKKSKIHKECYCRKEPISSFDVKEENNIPQSFSIG